MEWARRLPRSDFPVQTHIDLHGYTITAAQPALETFLLDAIVAGRQSVLVIHSRELSLPRETDLTLYRNTQRSRFARWENHRRRLGPGSSVAIVVK
ncbi:MAG: Smr/MutS family protein [Deltaproteobacteria bacterium]|nr:Smr/MutS family protein [Deltaproteobacteria bacterium]